MFSPSACSLSVGVTTRTGGSLRASPRRTPAWASTCSGGTASLTSAPSARRNSYSEARLSAAPWTIAAVIWPASPPLPRRLTRTVAGVPDSRASVNPAGMTNPVRTAERSSASLSPASVYRLTSRPSTSSMRSMSLRAASPPSRSATWAVELNDVSPPNTPTIKANSRMGSAMLNASAPRSARKRLTSKSASRVGRPMLIAEAPACEAEEDFLQCRRAGVADLRL